VFDPTLINGATARALDEQDPLPPDDRLTHERLTEELEALYRIRATRLADQLARTGSREPLDLVHEAFVRILGLSVQRRAAIAKSSAYVTQVSRNLRNDEGRSETVRVAWLDEASAAAAQHHDQIVYLESRDALRRLEAAVLKLKPRTRDIFIARRVNGLSYAEISELTGLSTKAIEKHMAKAIAKLSRFMDRS
jgi:RNA polymerase sigma-70 factor (ECF subfamily)